MSKKAAEENESKPKTITLNPDEISKIIANAQIHKQKNKHYPDEVKIFALSLRASNYTMPQIAQIMSISVSTVHEWINDPQLESFRISELSESVKRRLSNRMYLAAQQALIAAFEDKKVDKASTLQLTTAMAQLVDKARLMDSEPTQIVSYETVAEDLQKEIAGHEENIIDIEAQIMELENCG